MRYAEAVASLPLGARVSSSFGYPGDGPCSVYFKFPDGSRWVVSNGVWPACNDGLWTAERVRERGGR